MLPGVANDEYTVLRLYRFEKRFHLLSAGKAGFV